MIRNAKDNATKEMQIITLADTLIEMGVEVDKDPAGMLILRSKDYIYGAGLIVSEKVRQKVKGLFGGKSYLIPSSIHEWIIIPKSVITSEDLLTINGQVNEDVVTSDEYLATGIYEINEEGELVNVYDMEGLL